MKTIQKSQNVNASDKNGHKILIVGLGKYEFYELALYNALCNLKYNTKLFTWQDILGDKPGQRIKNFVKRIESHLNKNLFYLRKINKQLIKECEKENPDIIFFYNTRIFDKKTIDTIKRMGIKIVAFSNDDPFSTAYPKYWWKKYLYIAKKADIVYAYRRVNMQEYKQMGCKNVELLLPYYMDSRNYMLSDGEKLDVPDVVYIGHVENDERRQWINALLKAGIKVGIKSDTASYYDQCDNLIPIGDTHKNYNAILSSAKICLVFLSTKNRDQYTRRCFEIPATGSMMLSIYTDEMTQLFAPDKEAVYFKDGNELVEKCKKYLADDKLRESVAKSGYERLIKDGHEIKDRARQIMRDCEKLFN